MRVSVFGLGYVGSVLCGCLADSGHEVVGVDIQRVKVEAMNQGNCGIVEHGLEPLVKNAVRARRLRATQNPAEAIKSSELSLICVGTPTDHRGAVDLRALERVCMDIGRALRHVDTFHSVVFRSTVLPGTTRSVAVPILERESGKQAGRDFGAGYNPEFLREGNAVADFYDPPFTVIGAMDPVTLQRIRVLYDHIKASILELSLECAELLKSVCNCFHAMKVAWANEIGSLCSVMGLDGVQLMEIFCQDTKLNLSPKYLRPGFAFGGSCLPKDLRALAGLAESLGTRVPLLAGILESNEAHMRRAEDVIIATGKTRIGIMGLSFKTGTDDTRESPALRIARTLLEKGCDVWAYEPDLNLDRLVGVNREYLTAAFPNFAARLVSSGQELARCTDVLVITKPDPRYRQLVSALGPHHVVVDLVRLFAGHELPCPSLSVC